jgi:5-methylcytosine-specific restriction endonuclease McrA
VRLRVCRECGRNEFVRRDNASEQCKSCAARKAGRKGAAALRRPAFLADCTHCGGRFRTTTSQQARGRGRYCSRACQRLATSVERQCRTCVRSFRVPRSVVNGTTNASGNFCSRACYERHLCRTERTTGRGSRWRAERTEALRRAPFCGRCGTLRRLEVHHIIPFRLTYDNAQDNLIPLCKRCHKIVECVFHDLEPHVEGDFVTAKLFLRSGLTERQRGTLCTLLKLWRALFGQSHARALAA